MATHHDPMSRSLAIVLTALCAVQTTLQAQEVEYWPGRILVMMGPGHPPDVLADDLAIVEGKRTGLRVDRELSAPMRAWLLEFDHEAVPQPVMLRAVRGHRAVQLAQNDHRIADRSVPNDPQYPQQWHHGNIASEGAWSISTGGVTAAGDTIVVCIIERADLPHPDLSANAWVNHAEIPGNGIDDDGNGFIDDHLGWDPGQSNDDVFGGAHGTQVAGMAGATGNNDIGVVGASWDVKLMVVDHGGVSESQVLAAYTYPLVMRRLYNESGGTLGAFVVATNASWGTNGGTPADAPIWCAMYDTLGTAGILNCGATSNSNVDVDVVGDLPTSCPSDFMVSVTATNSADMRTFSAYGATTIDVGAPGSAVRTTTLGGGYGNATGTSFASPLTAGVIGLLYSTPCPALMELVHADPVAGAQYVRQMLFDGVDQVGNLPGETVSGGRINAANSMQLIMAACGSCPPPFNLQALNTAIGEADLSWSAISAEGFTLRYRPVGGSDWIEMEGLTSSTQAITGIAACQPHEFQVTSFCADEEGGTSTNFTWLSEGCCDHPGVPWAQLSDVDSVQLVWGNVLAALHYDLRWRPVGTDTWIEVPGLSGNTYTITGLEACTGHEVQTRSTCAGEFSEWSESALVFTTGCGACVDLTYCTSSSANSITEWIEQVAIGTIDHVSGNDGGYGDHTGLSTMLPIGEAVPFTFTPGYSFFAFGQWFRVFLDLDRDGSFNGPGEMVYDAEGTVNVPLSASLTIPQDTEPGPSRMRIVMKYQTPVAGGCVANYDYGETEDYCVDLLPFNNVDGSDSTEPVLVQVIPAPDGQTVTFILHGAPVTYPLEVSVLDHSGREVGRGILREGRVTLPAGGWAGGLYVYRIFSPGAVVAQGRFPLLR